MEDLECEAFPELLLPLLCDWVGILQCQESQPLTQGMDQDCAGLRCGCGGELSCCPCGRNTADTLDRRNP